MKILHKAIAAVVVFACILFVVYLVLKAQTSSVTAPNIELIFGDHLISYVLEDDDLITFSLFGVQSLSKHPVDLSEAIIGLEFNNPRIKIENFQFLTGACHNHYQLFNLLVDVNLTSKDVEKTDTLIVHTKRGTKRYPIGEMILTNHQGNVAEIFEIVNGEYRVLYPISSSLPFEVHLRNRLNENVVIEKICDLSNTVFCSKEIPVNAKKYQFIEIRTLEEKKSFDFYTFTPILICSANNGVVQQVLPGVQYGAFIDESEMIQKIIY